MELGFLTSKSVFFKPYFYIPSLYLADFKVEVMLGFRIFCHLIIVPGRTLNSVQKCPPSRRSGAGAAPGTCPFPFFSSSGLPFLSFNFRFALPC